MSRQGAGPYTNEFYRDHREVSLRSAHQIVPLVLRLVRPRSVVDVGCGVGTWLSVFREHGITDVCGIDGDWVDRTKLVIPADRFLAADVCRPLPVDRRFDLALSLEVAEHLPAQCAAAFVDSLTGLAPVVLFSAAIPFQGGTGHVNEQWPEYWVEHFQRKGYAVIDCIRRAVWDNADVEWYYAQNTLLFARPELVERSRTLRKERAGTATSQLSLVHPRTYLKAVAEMRRLVLTAQDIAALIPPGDRFILVDDDVLRGELGVGSRAIPFLEREGRYWGLPADDMTAIRELERLRAGGAGFVVFAWPSFWWLEYYSGFHEYLRSRFPCLPRTDRVVAFDLRGRR
jgi:SAM-dependent methyltransferase